MKQTMMYNANNFESHKEFFSDHKGYLYILRLTSDEEDFYKVGITAENRLKYRFKELEALYNVDIKFLEKGLTTEKYEVEQLFLEEFKQYKYTPLNHFTGYTECLTVNPVAEYYNWFYNTYR